MKLLKPSGCLFPGGGGNVKKLTTLVEGQGIGFRTRVRLPSGPSTTPVKSRVCGVVKNIGNSEVTKLSENTKGERLNGAPFVKNMEI